MRTIYSKIAISVLAICIATSAGAQESYYPSEQRVFSSGAFSDLNVAYIGRWDGMRVGLERAKDWAGFEGNPEAGLVYANSRIGSSNSSVGLGFKFDRIAAFSRNEVNLSYAYSIKMLGNGGMKPLRLILGIQPSIDFFKADYEDVFSDLYPAAVPPEGLDQASFGFNAGFIITNGGFEDRELSTWYAGFSSRLTGISLGDQEQITDLGYQEFVAMTGLRQNLNNEDVYLDATGYATLNSAGVDVAGLVNVEKYNPNNEDAMGGWIGVGLKSNSSFAGAKQMVVQLGLISRLFEGKDALLRIGLSLETDIGPYALLGNRYGLLVAFQN